MSADTESLRTQIRDKQAVVGVIGLGYVGLPLLDAFLDAGFRCIGFDVDQSKIDALSSGKSYIRHIPDDQIQALLPALRPAGVLIPLIERGDASRVVRDEGGWIDKYMGDGMMAVFGRNTDPQEAARQALVNLGAKPCPSGRMPVVIGNGFGGVIFHEACGHLLETTSVAKKASVFHDKMGEMIANPAVSAVDDGTITNEWGSINIDDEGMTTQHTQLIKDGKLTSFLVDRIGSEQTGFERTGSGRRESYKFAPASRMRNTFIEPGEVPLDDMIGSIDRGIYASHMGGGSVQPGTGEFNFAVTEGYYIENGKVQHPVKAATLISTGPAVLKEISMVGSDFSLACGMCGSVSGAVPTSVGQATLKVDDILVGGNA